jgi:hypothetical protein
MVCAALFAVLNAVTAGAAAKAPAKKPDTKASDMQCKEVTITGTIELKEEKDAAGKVKGKAYFLIDSKKVETKLPNSNVKYKDFEGLKVKAVCMQLGPRLLSVKSMEAVDKAAFEAKQAEAKAEAAKQAEAKKAAQQKK